MRTSVYLVVGVPAMLAAVQAFAGPLNFRNVTATNVVQTAPESFQNEKHVDFGDFDNDGDLDIVIAAAFSDFGSRRNKLYRNDVGIFTEVSGAPVIAGFSATDVSRNAFLLDFDGDDWLDIVVINDGNTGIPSKLYRNVQADGSFSHFEESGIGIHGASSSAVAVDIDLDDDIDLFFGNTPNTAQEVLLLNDGLGSFTDVTATYVPPDTDFTVDVAAGDLNGDGKLDILLSNDGALNNVNKIYYNDLPDTDSAGPGDFRYQPDGIQLIANPSADENAMEPGDFDGDGLMDVYWSQAFGGDGDRILRNTGNGVDGKAVFDPLPLSTLPQSVTGMASRKATVADLNDDGRLDIIVMKRDAGNSRPTILRNVTVNGDTEFIDWTPGGAFPDGQLHRGWHAAAFDADGDGDVDVFLGGWEGDHLFANVPPLQFVEADLKGRIFPPLFNRDAAAVTGTAAAGETDTYHTVDEQTGFISVVLTGPDDYRLEIQTTDRVTLGESHRGGAGVEEALQVDVTGPTRIVVEVLDCGPAPGDTDGDCTVGITDLLDLLAAWGPNPGHPADLDGDGEVGIIDFLSLLALWGPVTHEYQLELLTRA